MFILPVGELGWVAALTSGSHWQEETEVGVSVPEAV